MKSLKGISSFVAVAQCGSFSAAAKQQGVSAVAIGKNVATLERQLGVRLFQRTTRSLGLTAEGETYYRQCLEPLRALQAAQATVQASAKGLTGLVRVTCVSPFATAFVLPLIAEFHVLHPAVHIELHWDDAVSDMVAQGYDVGIRVGALTYSTVVARAIADLPFVVCASPDYFKRHPRPVDLADLQQHHCIRLRRAGQKNAAPWPLRGMTSAGTQALKGNLYVNTMAALVAAAVAGQGLVCVPLPLVMPLLRAGQLAPALPEWVEPKVSVYLHYLNRKNLPARTRVFVEFVLARLREHADLQTPAQALLAPFAATFVR